MRLNVGCGADSWGDVRIDVVKDYWMTGFGSPANMRADAQYLPFRDKCFDELRVHEVLEHVRDWRRALYECCRVAKKMSITVPIDSNVPKKADWFIMMAPTPTYFKYLLRLRKLSREHLWQFDISLLTSAMKKLGFKHVHVSLTYHPILGFLAYGRKKKYFRFLNERFRAPRSWKVVAF